MDIFSRGPVVGVWVEHPPDDGDQVGGVAADGVVREAGPLDHLKHIDYVYI